MSKTAGVLTCTEDQSTSKVDDIVKPEKVGVDDGTNSRSKLTVKEKKHRQMVALLQMVR